MSTFQYSSPLHFHKLQGAGNDFVVLDLISHPLPTDFDFEKAAITLCDRHTGVGGDGLLTLELSGGSTAIRKRMWNPDGTEDMCGNGLRCVAALAWRQKHVTEPTFTVATLAGERQIEVLNPNLIRQNMGMPVFESAQIPVRLPSPYTESIEWKIAVADREFTVSSLSTGSTHTVIFIDEPLSEQNFQTYSPLLENHSLFPDRTSLMWAVPDGPNRYSIRIWERGAGETLACGTGACAVAVAATVTGRANGPVEVQSRGGVLEVEWQPGQEIILTGPARHVYEGVFVGD